jgi:hypothetical protein
LLLPPRNRLRQPSSNAYGNPTFARGVVGCEAAAFEHDTIDALAFELQRQRDACDTAANDAHARADRLALVDGAGVKEHVQAAGSSVVVQLR